MKPTQPVSWPPGYEKLYNWVTSMIGKHYPKIHSYSDIMRSFVEFSKENVGLYERWLNGKND